MSSRKDVLERQLVAISNKLAELESRPAAPDWDEGLGNPVVRFDLHIGGRNYSYTAIQVGQHWYTTGSMGPIRHNDWDALLDWMDNRLVGEIWIVSGYEALS